MTDPVLPLVASQLGGSAFVAGLSVSVDRIMTVTFSLPASTAIQRLGAPATMALGAAVGGVASLAAAFAGSIFSLILALFVIGAGNAMWKVTRTSLIGVLCPPELRGRAIAFNTGVTRLAQIIGPAAGGFVEAAWPMERTGVSFPLMLRGICNLLAALFVVLAAATTRSGKRGGSGGSNGGGSSSTHGKQKEGLASSSALGTFALVRKHRAEFLGAGVAATLVLGTNMCRRALVPMVGARLGLPVEVIGIAMTTMGAHLSDFLASCMLRFQLFGACSENACVRIKECSVLGRCRSLAGK
jgi:MFS family permease